MRAVLALIVLALGAGLAGKWWLDSAADKHPNVAVRAGGEVYLIPAAFVRTDGWRTDLMRVAGCWDAREAALIGGIEWLAGCEGVRRVPMDLPTREFGLDVAMGIRREKLALTLWPHFDPPTEQMAELSEAWAAKGAWSQRTSVLRADWQLWRVEAAASPWVYLLSNMPSRGDEAELAQLYAGRCYRPEKGSDAGMTCSFALRAGATATLDFELGADEMMSFVALREALAARMAQWRQR